MRNEGNQTQRHADRLREADAAVRAGADTVKGDPYRLRYHFMPASGWMNDPNGLIHYRGEYHLFYQHYPYGDKWGPMHWGHAKSRDLVRWTHLPIALAPSEPYDLGDKDGYGCWSGSAVEKDGQLVLFYTGHVDGRQPTETQNMAVSEDGVAFKKYDGNPVIADAPDGECFGFRDPKVWRHGSDWYMVVGSGKDGRGRALLYRSADLTAWSYVGVAAESDGTMGDMWECPDLFPLGNKHVLIVSPMNMEGTKNLYFVGEMDYRTGKFRAECRAKLDDGFDFYAPQTLLDDRGRRILIGWMDMWGSRMIEGGRGWYGAMTLPRELRLLPDGTLASAPVPELAALRGEAVACPSLRLEAEATQSWARPAAMEWAAELDLAASDADELAIALGSGDDADEATVIRCRLAERKLVLDRSRSGIGDGGAAAADLPAAGDRLKLHLFVDASSVELFACDGRRVLTSRIYPKQAANLTLRLSAVGGAASFAEWTMWPLDAAGGADE